MANPFLQTHYRQDATDLDYHIRKERIHDIWNNCEWSQQSKKYELAEILSTDKKAKLYVSEMFKKVNIEMKKVRIKGCTITSKLATGA
ncbi:hypothetical protein C1645_788252 [Glomus cerebriforme]|uniref:Uncharacterized protein n=1 Tax=Glomus cerebriforme TaxID=658196 RepID=A0A397S800_9GLOM|nr:hypothetical protein C1645_788252 [Glomus cerebriforme]